MWVHNSTNQPSKQASKQATSQPTKLHSVFRVECAINIHVFLIGFIHLNESYKCVCFQGILTPNDHKISGKIKPKIRIFQKLRFWSTWKCYTEKDILMCSSAVTSYFHSRQMFLSVEQNFVHGLIVFKFNKTEWTIV